MSVRVVLVDDHNVVRHGLRLLLEQEEFEVVGEAEDGLAAIALVEELRPQVVVMDLELPRLNGLEATEQILKIVPETRVVILSMHADELHVIEALRRGASGYVRKDSAGDNLITAIREAVAGRRYLSPPLSDAALEAYVISSTPEPSDLLSSLTSRERQVAEIVAEGLSAKEVAERLSISPRTVEAHRANVLRKLKLRNVLELVRMMNNGRS